VVVGIEKINLYGGRFFVDSLELAEANGKDTRQVMIEQRSVTPPFEDPITLAVNAGRRLLDGTDPTDIELLMVGSESAVDFSKATSTWVQRFCGLPANCRTFDVKLACYGATGAVKMAASWVASQARPGKKALVISTDFTRADTVKSGLDFIGGGCAAAMLISDDPQVLEIDLARAGYWTDEISDTHRPTSMHEIVHTEKVFTPIWTRWTALSIITKRSPERWITTGISRSTSITRHSQE
jgi:hydroxymethylglutaryl-CoA synthase